MIFRRLEDRAIIRQAPGGAYYLDEPSWKAVRATRQRVMVIVLLISVVLIGYAYSVAVSRNSRSDVPVTESN